MFDSSSPGLDLRAALHPFHSALCCCRLRPTDRFPQGTGPFTCGDSTCSHASNQGSCYCIEWCTDACGALTHIRSPKRRTSSDHWNAIIGDVEPCLCCAFFPTGCFGILLLRINNGLMPHLHASSESGRWETRPGLPCKLFANLMFFWPACCKTVAGLTSNALIALQLCGASSGNAFCLSNIIAATAVIGLQVPEGVIVKRVLKPVPSFAFLSKSFCTCGGCFAVVPILWWRC